MKIAYLVLAHNTPNHLKRLCKALSSEASHVFVHWDKRAGRRVPCDFNEDHITFLKDRVRVFWGDFSQVEAELKLLKAAYDRDAAYDRFVLLSGSDYPLRSVSYIEDYFRNNRDVEFMNLVRMSMEKKGNTIWRLTTYKLRPSDSRIVNAVKKLLIKVRLLAPCRDYKESFEGLVPYGGSAWWALGREAAAHVLQFTEQRTRFVNYLKNTHIPDESFFHTVLGNSEFKSRIKRSLTYVDWSAGGPNPAFMTDEHVRHFLSEVPCRSRGANGGAEVLFARKFSDDSEAMVSMLESRNREEQERLTQSV